MACGGEAAIERGSALFSARLLGVTAPLVKAAVVPLPQARALGRE